MIQAVILAAGRGKRMGKYTEECTKVMLPIPTNEDKHSTNKKPMLARTVENCTLNGITDFVFVVGYRKDDIVKYFGNGKHLGVNVTYVVQNDICGGTADAVRVVENVLNTTKFILIYGDVVPSTDDIFNLVQKASKGQNVMGTRFVKDPSRYGVVEMNSRDEIIRIVEKSPNPPSNSINAGVYVLPNPEIFGYIRKTKKSPRGEYELTDSIQHYIEDGGVINSCPVSNLDIGTQEEYEKL